jgi:hypothetical protein
VKQCDYTPNNKILEARRLKFTGLERELIQPIFKNGSRNKVRNEFVDYVIPFGFNKGKKIKDLTDKDGLSHVSWCLNKCENLSLKDEKACNWWNSVYIVKKNLAFKLRKGILSVREN